jgi:hypothetical protein
VGEECYFKRRTGVMQTVNVKLAEISLEHTTASDFERFFHAFYPALAGIDFVPLGGIHDGGADAFQGDGLLEGRTARAGTYYQATTQADHRAKIRHTVRRLRASGRDPKTLQYFTSRTVALIDKEEEDLSAELDVAVKIRDRKWIAVNINHSPQTVAAFRTHLAPCVAFLGEPGSATIIKSSPNISVRTMCVFLGQEVDRRRGNTDLLEAVTDSLILWALEDTDPDKGILMRRDEILNKIENALPSAKHFVRGVFDHRIEAMATKGSPAGREVRWHKKEDKFCLPYETRKIVELENTEDEFLKLQVLDLYNQRATKLLGSVDLVLPDDVALVAHRALELTFEKEGLELAEFLSGTHDENYYGSISDQVDEAIVEHRLNGPAAITGKEVALAVLRQAFYDSTEEERIYYGKLSRTYALMFTLRNEPKIVEYFKGMSSNFVLFIGSDIIVRALSEMYLADEDQMTANMLRILCDAGSRLILTRMVVDEIHAHLEGTDYEFQNYFMDMEPYIGKEIARHSRKILIRAYFYAKNDPLLGRRPAGWKSFIGQICSYDDLHKPATSKGQVRNYLVEKFGFEYVGDADIEQLVEENEVRSLAEKLKGAKSEEILAINDARQILAVYGKRHELREEHRPNPYGYRTWWLTHETKVRQYTGDLVRSRGAQYIIRPEFILNFVALSPTTEQVRKSYSTVFPTLLGVRLSNRMREDIFHDVMKRAKEVRAVDEARAKVMMSDMSNRLKGDNFKRYEADLLAGRGDRK